MADAGREFLVADADKWKLRGLCIICVSMVEQCHSVQLSIAYDSLEERKNVYRWQSDKLNPFHGGI